LPEIDFVRHAESLGAIAERAVSIGDFEQALERARGNERTTVVVIETDPLAATAAGGHWWDVAVPEVSVRKEVRAARKAYEQAARKQRVGD
jgi:3D-(3,5/4)-trihydroxycyclohexane-1,2-dione acylhydrolase (decyclizing)